MNEWQTGAWRVWSEGMDELHEALMRAACHSMITFEAYAHACNLLADALSEFGDLLRGYARRRRRSFPFVPGTLRPLPEARWLLAFVTFAAIIPKV